MRKLNTTAVFGAVVLSITAIASTPQTQPASLHGWMAPVHDALSALDTAVAKRAAERLRHASTLAKLADESDCEVDAHALLVLSASNVVRAARLAALCATDTAAEDPVRQAARELARRADEIWKETASRPALRDAHLHFYANFGSAGELAVPSSVATGPEVLYQGVRALRVRRAINASLERVHTIAEDAAAVVSVRLAVAAGLLDLAALECDSIAVRPAEQRDDKRLANYVLLAAANAAAAVDHAGRSGSAELVAALESARIAIESELAFIRADGGAARYSAAIGDLTSVLTTQGSAR